MKFFIKPALAPHGVECMTCDAQIPVRQIEALPEAFSVPCPHCGRRSVYNPRHIKKLALEQTAAPNSFSAPAPASADRKRVREASRPWHR